VLLPAQKSIINNLNGFHTVYDAKQDCIAGWTHDRATVDWDFRINTPGTYRVTFVAAAEKDSSLNISLANESLNVRVPASGGFETFQSVDAGTIAIEKAGDVTIHIEPSRRGWNPINLRLVELAPVN
jgi:alpha-L-fucosidase